MLLLNKFIKKSIDLPIKKYEQPGRITNIYSMQFNKKKCIVDMPDIIFSTTHISKIFTFKNGTVLVFSITCACKSINVYNTNIGVGRRCFIYTDDKYRTYADRSIEYKSIYDPFLIFYNNLFKIMTFPSDIQNAMRQVFQKNDHDIDEPYNIIHPDWKPISF